MKLSTFGEKFTTRSGILELMDDMGKALSSGNEMIMMGGGNPASIPEINELWKNRMQEILLNENEFKDMLGNYDPPQGNPRFINSIVDYFNNNYNWNLTEKNIAVTNGSQNAFFYLFNMLAGRHKNGNFKKILFPLSPEYIGYADQGIDEDMFISFKPEIRKTKEHEFKYYIDFENINIDKDTAAICVSRPTNPTGNVITDQEIIKLSKISKENSIPLIIDNAYGAPFPNILFEEITPFWNENIILSMSLSKIGLPSVRNGFIIANEEIIKALESVNAVVSLANSKPGQIITAPLIKENILHNISREIVMPFYKKKSYHAMNLLTNRLTNNKNFYIHKSESAIFLWLWFENLPITCMELYKILKEKNVLVVPGCYFFPGLNENWQHKNECIRINYSGENIDTGLNIIADVIEEIYNN